LSSFGFWADQGICTGFRGVSFWEVQLFYNGRPKKASIYEYKTTKSGEFIQHLKSCL
jgi:hypothetical protein